MHPQPIIASILVCGVIAVVAMVRPRRKREESDDYFILWGDVPFVPEGARQRRAIGGANSLTTDAHNRTTKVIARPHGGAE